MGRAGDSRNDGLPARSFLRRDCSRMAFLVIVVMVSKRHMTILDLGPAGLWHARALENDCMYR